MKRQWLVDLRKKKFGSLAKFAAAIGTSAQTVVQWENGTNPSRKLMTPACKALGITPSKFYKENE